jgi:hypothetical protein
MEDDQILTGKIIEEIQTLRTMREEGSWIVLDALLTSESMIEFAGRKPSMTELVEIKRNFGYSEAKMLVNFDLGIIVIQPVDVAGRGTVGSEE